MKKSVLGRLYWLTTTRVNSMLLCVGKKGTLHTYKDSQVHVYNGFKFKTHDLQQCTASSFGEGMWGLSSSITVLMSSPSGPCSSIEGTCLCRLFYHSCHNRWDGTCKRKNKKAYTFSLWKPEGFRHLENLAKDGRIIANSILLEKLIVPQLVRKFSTFYEARGLLPLTRAHLLPCHASHESIPCLPS